MHRSPYGWESVEESFAEQRRLRLWSILGIDKVDRGRRWNQGREQRTKRFGLKPVVHASTTLVLVTLCRQHRLRLDPFPTQSKSD